MMKVYRTLNSAAEQKRNGDTVINVMSLQYIILIFSAQKDEAK